MDRRPGPPLNVLAGQLFIVCLDRRVQIMDAMRAHRGNYYGGVFLSRGHLEDPERARRLTFRFRRHSREIPPPFVAIDEEGGLVSNIGHLTAAAPSPAALAAVDDPEVTRDVYLGIGEKLRALGFNTVFAPCVDVNTEAANPVIGTRSFGSTAEQVIKHATAALAGLRDAGVVSCIKHFPGHGATTRDSHLTLPVVEADRDTLEDRELEPFRMLTSATDPPELVMTAHVAYPALQRGDVPATLSPAILQGVLRREIGFQGLAVTDSMEMKGITERYGPEKAAVEAILAGADVLLYALDPDMAAAAYQGVQEAVRTGKITEERLMVSVDRVLRLRARFRGMPWITDDDAEEVLDMRHDQAFYQSATDGIVLEGNAGVLAEIPENPGPKVIVLPTRLDEHRELPLDVVREQLEPEGFRVLEAGANPGAEEIGRLEGQAAEASVVVVGTASRGPMSEENRQLVAALTRRDVIKVGVALLDPGDADHMLTANCRMKTFGFSGTQLWGMCQKLVG